VGLARLSKVTLFVPRAESANVVSKLAEFEWFHPIPVSSTSDYSNPEIDDLLLHSQKQFQSIDEIVRSLNIKPDIGIMDTLKKGAKKPKKDFNTDEIKSLLDSIDRDSRDVLEKSRNLLNERASLNKEIDDLQSFHDTLKMVSNLNINIDNIRDGSIFSQRLYLMDSKDTAEIERSLSGLAFITIPVNNVKSVIFIFCSTKELDRVNKVLRSFDISPFAIPKSLPQNPKSAYEKVRSQLDSLSKKKKEIDTVLKKHVSDNTNTLLAFRESSLYCKDVLEAFRKPGGLKNFAVIRGFIPTDVSDEFNEVTKTWYSTFENIIPDVHGEVNPNFPKNDEFDVGDVLLDNPKHISQSTADDGKKQEHRLIPSLFANKRYFRSFEPITLTQGYPKNDEFDPSPMIAFIFPILYGLMFGDFGQGAVIAAIGAIFRIRGIGTIQRWGTLILASGISAMVVGLLVGEFFGFHIVELPGAEALRSIGFIGFLNATDFTQENVMTILTISINIGIIHISSALSLNIYKGLKEGRTFEVVSQRLPILVMYLSIVSLLLAAVGANYQVMGMFENINPAPFFSNIFGNWVTVEIVAKIAAPILIATMVIQIIAVPIGIKRGKLHFHGSFGEEMFITIIEVMLIRLVELFANTISYSRIGIMLLVHVALMATTTGGVEFYLNQGIIPLAIFMFLLGNIGVMLLEGLIVYIQALRLHLYEYFTKFFEGNGIPFKKLTPDLVYSNITWKNK
jgi:V/A-type H+-transporting ATPase subunit I